MNGIQGSSAASWAQFVKLKQAARERNSGFSIDGNLSTVRTEKATPKLSAASVYSEQQLMINQTAKEALAAEEHKNIKGNNFDAYA